jgi:hypothetical protein
MFAFRSSLYNPQYDKVSGSAAVAPARVEGEAQGPSFAVDDDWGDDSNEPSMAIAAAPPAVEVILGPTAPRRVAFQRAPPGRTVGRLPAAPFPLLALDTFEEPAKEKENHGTLEEQLRAVDAVHGEGSGVIDMTSVEDDDETDEERLLRKFVKRIDRCPSQCLRWCPDSQPLLCQVERSTKIPACGCGAPRRFEFQLVPPAIYYLTRTLGEKNHKLHFGTALVYTCSVNCYLEETAYSPEYVLVQSEI